MIEEDFGNSHIGKLRKYLWNMTEYPETSLWARVNTFKLYFTTLFIQPKSMSNTCLITIYVLFLVIWIHILIYGIDINNNLYSTNSARITRRFAIPNHLLRHYHDRHSCDCILYHRIFH